MTGSVHIIVQNERVKYEFVLRRNLTIIRGDSATGKTTLVGRALCLWMREAGIECVSAAGKSNISA